MKLLLLPICIWLFLLSISVSKGQVTNKKPIIDIGPAILNDSTYTELQTGRVLTYRLRVDQHVVNGRGVCISAVYTIAILHKDADGNSHISVEMRSAGELIPSDTIFLTKSTEMKIVGVRLAFAIPMYEATLDVHGNIATLLHDSDAMTHILSTIPTEYALMAPYHQGTSHHVGNPYRDTILLRSAIQQIGRTTGSETGQQSHANQDTIIRTVLIDSVSGICDEEIAHMNVRMERFPVHGVPSVAISVMERYVKKGYMKSFVTTSRKVGSTSPIPEYIATSVLNSSRLKD